MDSEDLFIRFDEWLSKIQGMVDECKGTIEAVNVLMVVASFIAGVQAQLVSSIVTLPNSHLARAAKFFAFVGLTFEITVTFLGAIHLVRLRREYEVDARALSHLTQCKAYLNLIVKFFVQQNIQEQPDQSTNQSLFYGQNYNVTVNTMQVVMTNKPTYQLPGLDDVNDQQDRARSVKEVLDRMKSHHEDLAPPRLIEKIYELLEKASPTTGPSAPTTRRQLRRDTSGHMSIINESPQFERPVFIHRNMPLMSMGAGVVFLAISTILLAAAQVNTEAWIGCIGVCVGVVTMSFLPMRYGSPVNLVRHNRRHLPIPFTTSPSGSVA